MESFDPIELSKQYTRESGAYWAAAGAETALTLFQEAAKNVEAYADFLKKENIDPATITSIEDFQKIPPATKKNYFDAYSLPQLVLGGNIAQNYLICTSSGTSGKPHYWPRLKDQDTIEPALIELMYNFLGLEPEKKTLIISCLAMGTWVAANMMIDASLEIARKSNLNLSVITPGAMNRRQILDIVSDLGPYYDQLILIGYPPTIRNLIVEGKENGVHWPDYHPKLVVGGEPVTQHWKEFILENIGSTCLTDIGVVFGMAETHLVAYETPIASYIRALMTKHPRIAQELFKTTTVGALLQFDPSRRWLEEVDGNLLLTARTGIPMLRYASGDKGGVYSFDELIEKLSQHDINIYKVLEEHGIAKDTLWQWPFFYCNGRGDSVSIMGANLYPENIDKFFHAHPEIHDYKISVRHSEAEEPELWIYLELREHHELSPTEVDNFIVYAERELLDLFMTNNEDFLDAYNEEPAAMVPHITICPYNQAPFDIKQAKQQHVLK